MKNLLIVFGSVIFCFLLFLSSCGPSTEITGSWRTPKEIGRPLNNIMITAITENTTARQTVENDLASILSKSGIKTVKSMDVFPPSFTQGKQPDKDTMLREIQKTEADAILTVALIDRDTENRYVPGTFGYEPMARYGYYGRFWGYYSNWMPVAYSPGYYTQDKVYFIETNLYDARNEELIWSAQSETYNPDGLVNFSKDFATVVRNKMREDGIINAGG